MQPLKIFPSYIPPGPGPYSRFDAYRMLEVGNKLRTCDLWQFPVLPGAFLTCLDIAAGREWRLSGPVRGVQRAAEWLHNAATFSYDGTIDYGYESFVKRIYGDSMTLGRMQWTWEDEKPLRYCDPPFMRYNVEERQWYDYITKDEFDYDKVVTYHPVPIGANGLFIAPLSSVITTAQLAWLIREHDKASADGRKIRDMFIVNGEALADQMKDSVEQIAAIWAGADPTKDGINIIHVDLPQGTSVADMVHRLGLANIPETLEREKFALAYANEISSCLGLSLRHFFNGNESNTNRSLEEVQEARQSTKGPAAFMRSFQRQMNQSGALKQFGRNIRFEVVEEIDSQSQKVDAEVLRLYAEAFSVFADKLQGVVDLSAMVAWMQSKGQLPADLEIIASGGANSTTLVSSDQARTPKEGETIEESDKEPSTLASKEKAIGYGEIAIDQTGRIVERRKRVISVSSLMEKAATRRDKGAQESASFRDVLLSARTENKKRFLTLASWHGHDDSEFNRLKVACLEDTLTERDYQIINDALIFEPLLEKRNAA